MWPSPRVWRERHRRRSAFRSEREQSFQFSECCAHGGGASLLAHVEEAKARETVVDQKLLLHKLMLDLAKLNGTHAVAIRGKLASRMFFEGNKEVFRSSSSECGKELLFQHCENAFEGFHLL